MKIGKSCEFAYVFKVLLTVASVLAEESSSSDTCFATNSIKKALIKRLLSLQHLTTDPTLSESPLPATLALFRVTSCDEAGAIWQYRFRTQRKSKGTRRLLGQGRISFTQERSVANNFDFGLKSSQCIVLNPDLAHLANLELDVSKISSIEGKFDEQGAINGLVEINMFDNSMIRATMAKSVFVDKVLYFEPVETNIAAEMDKDSKRLSQIHCLSNETGRSKDFKYRLMSNGNIVFDDNKAFVMVIVDDEDDKIIFGKIDDDILVQPSEALLTGIEDDFDNCQLPKLLYDKSTKLEKDFDMVKNVFVSVNQAKLRRFLENLANKDWQLWSNDDKNNEDNKEIDDQSVYSLRVLETLKPKQLRIETLDGVVDARLDGSIDLPELNGRGVFHVLSDIKRHSSSDKSNITEQNAKNEEEKSRDGFEDDFYTLSQLISMNTNRQLVSTISTAFMEGRAEGRTKIVFTDGTVMEGFSKRGRLEGLVRRLDRALLSANESPVRFNCQLDPIPSMIASTTVTHDEPQQEVVSVAIYKRGLIVGPLYTFLIGGSILYVPEIRPKKGLTENKVTSSKAAFITPDLSHAIVGDIVDSQIQNGHLVGIKGLEESNKSFLKSIIFEDNIKNSANVSKVGFAPKLNLLVEDNLEKDLVYVNKSLIKGQGLFSKHNIESNTPVAYFGGLRLSLDEYDELVRDQIYPQYSMRFRLGAKQEEIVVFLPDELGSDTGKYRATMGHKINLDLENYNCRFVPSFHPRFGYELPMAVTTRFVAGNEELLCYYEHPFHLSQPWYQELWRRQVDHDWPEGPFGPRAKKTNRKVPLMVTDEHLAKEFHDYAINQLGLKIDEQ